MRLVRSREQHKAAAFAEFVRRFAIDTHERIMRNSKALEGKGGNGSECGIIPLNSLLLFESGFGITGMYQSYQDIP
jgi:hypothetical protein